MLAFDDEISGPGAAIISARDKADAIALANHPAFGISAALFTRVKAKADPIARQINAGSVFVDALVKADPLLSVGGVKHSGYGREFSWFGIQKFVNSKAICSGVTNAE